MKMLNVRLPEKLVSEIEAQSRVRRVSKSDIAREWLEAGRVRSARAGLQGIEDLIGSVVDDLPADLSARAEEYLRLTGYGRKRSR